MYKLEPSKAFEKSLKKLSTNEQRTVAEKLKFLIKDPFHPSFKLQNECLFLHSKHGLFAVKYVKGDGQNKENMLIFGDNCI